MALHSALISDQKFRLYSREKSNFKPLSNNFDENKFSNDEEH